VRRSLVVCALAALCLSLPTAYGEATPPINIQPEPPPGISTMVQKLINWLYWGAWVAVFGAGIYGGLSIAIGDSEKGKKFLGGAVIGAIVLAALTVIIPALVS